MPPAAPHPTPPFARLLLCVCLAAACQEAFAVETDVQLKSSARLSPPVAPAQPLQGPTFLEADEVQGHASREVEASGDVVIHNLRERVQANWLRYDQPADEAHARGNVVFVHDRDRLEGRELKLKLTDRLGTMTGVRFELHGAAKAPGGREQVARGGAETLHFQGPDHYQLDAATYTTCPLDQQDWVLKTEELKLDYAASVGTARHVRVEYMDTPILYAPWMDFSLDDKRKSGFLAPSYGASSERGLELVAPWYWNIAPNRDATLTPLLSAKRGAGAEAEFRYLEPSFQGAAQVHVLPNDQLTGRARHALNLSHEGALPLGASFTFNGLRVSDDAYWKDFPRAVPSITPRLLLADAAVRRDFDGWSSYARVHRWQVLQDDSARIEAPYDRSPQVGVRGTQRFGDGFEFALETELNRFTDPADGRADPLATTIRPTGVRWHALGSLARPFGTPGWTVTPRMAFNAAAYSLDEPLAGRRSSSRVIPTLSLDSHWQLERDASWLGRDVRQTLEPRLMYVNTPYRAQDARLAFDAAQRDFNFESLYAENAFSGVDRVSDAHQLTAGVTTRFLDSATGAEALRLGVVQRYLFRDQRITADCTPSADPLAAPDCTPLTQRFSDLLLLGSTNLSRRWTLDGSIQYSPDLKRTVRSILGARYSPGPYRTFGVTYRLARGLSEQLELGWQWPVYGRTPAEAAVAGGGECKGSWYSVGRINYSMRDSRITDSVIGFEYDAGCWIGRVVAERLSTGRSEATTRLLLQLELVGLSRLGSNPLQVLKDNIPGYKLLREERSMPAATRTYD